MNNFTYPDYQPDTGHLTENIQRKYIELAIKKDLLPDDAELDASIVSLTASNDPATPIQFWQLYSVLGAERINSIVTRFYDLVYEDEDWFKSVFERISSKRHHIRVQAAMWIDVMGGGAQYRGGEFRLNFHHAHNAFQLMNTEGARRWSELMVAALNDPSIDLTDDQRVRPALNTFLDYFMGKYAADFGFRHQSMFGEINPPHGRRYNFPAMTPDELETLTVRDLTSELQARGIDTSAYSNKQQMVYKALSL